MKKTVEYDTATKIVSISVDGKLAVQIHGVSALEFYRTPTGVFMERAKV